MKNLITIISLILLNPTFSYAKEEMDPPEVTLGERLFLETRFAQAYFAKPNKTDPILATTLTTKSSLRGAFVGKTINCRACHMVDEHANNVNAGIRTYADYANRSSIPLRHDDNKLTTRNSMSMVNISLPHKSQKNTTFHFDGEFASMEDLVKATLTGRNFGWKVTEEKLAIQHIAKIIRNDDGKGELAKEFGGAYANILKGSDKNLPPVFLLPKQYRIDVAKASDEEIISSIAKLISAYVSGLSFQVDEQGQYNGSPYDEFLKVNNLPRKALKNESNKDYSQRLLSDLNKLEQPHFVDTSNNKFSSHKQEFVFKEKELKGMKLFFSKASNSKSGGNCVSCHTAPDFSDFGFHNTGLAQENYDALHGVGAFNQLLIPQLVQRNRNYNAFLPATKKHPNAKSRFRAIANKNNVGYTDLGLWNVLGNQDIPAPQTALKTIMCAQAKEANKSDCGNASLLSNSIAAFKTPVLRDLGHSAPYMHTGKFNEFAEVIRLYIRSSNLAKQNKLRNREKNISEILLEEKDIIYLVSFLKALNEDYE